MKTVLLCLLIALVAPSVMSTKPKAVNNMLKQRLISDAELSITWYEIFDGFLDGAQVDTYVKNTTKCVKELERGNDDMNKVAYNVYWYGWKWEYYLDFNGALGDLTPIIRTCYDVVDNSTASAKAHFSRFKDFVDFANQAKDNVGRNIFSWYEIYTRITEAIARPSPREVAYQVGKALKLFFDFIPRSSNDNLTKMSVSLPDFRPFEDFAIGFLNGTRVISSPAIKK